MKKMILGGIVCAAMLLNVLATIVFAADIVARGSDSTIHIVKALAAAYQRLE